MIAVANCDIKQELEFEETEALRVVPLHQPSRHNRSVNSDDDGNQSADDD